MKRRGSKSPDEKSRWMSKARKVDQQIQRYAAFGYVTDLESWEADDAKLLKAVDRLYDAQRAAGLADDGELTAYREQLRAQFRETRNGAARLARADVYEGRAKRLRGGAAAQAGMQGYLDELAISRAKGQL